MRVLVAGGAGYVGSQLVPMLLKKGYKVRVFDLYLYGHAVFDAFKDNPHLEEIEGDVRDFSKVKEAISGCDHVVHLACISNDPSFELDPILGKSINFDAFEPFVKECKRQGVRRFIYASSSSVYGIKEVADVTEEMSLEPLTDYSRFKADCEKVLFKYTDENFITTVLRPATICGYAKRLRLDLVVNILTNIAYHTGKIKVMGGTNLRPNIHIKDMVEAYITVLESPEDKIQGEIFNVGSNNYSVLEIGNIVKKIVGNVEIENIPTNDNRSYHISSAKIAKRLQFVPKHTVEDAVKDLCAAFKEGKVKNSLDDTRYFNIKRMQEIKLR